MGDAMRARLTRAASLTVERFNGECCSEEIARVEALVRKSVGAAIVVGIGGGKTADTAKVAAVATGARIVIVPTIASTDAPCSAIAVRYTPDGVYQESISCRAIPTSSSSTAP